MNPTFTNEIESLLAYKLFSEVFTAPARKATPQREGEGTILPFRLSSIRSERGEQETELAA